MNRLHVAPDKLACTSATRIWYERGSGRLFVAFDGIVEGIALGLPHPCTHP